jgi:hypothetical protein
VLSVSFDEKNFFRAVIIKAQAITDRNVNFHLQLESIQETAFGLCLSSDAIENIILDQIQEDFEFIGGGQRYKCPRILAKFLPA